MALPICKTCVHYIPNGDCKKISTIDVVSGETLYSSARSVRADACGHEGRFYQPEPNVACKELTHDLYQSRFYIGYLYIVTLILLA